MKQSFFSCGIKTTQFSNIFMLKFQPSRKNILKTVREISNSVRENFSNITHVKIAKCVREKFARAAKLKRNM